MQHHITWGFAPFPYTNTGNRPQFSQSLMCDLNINMWMIHSFSTSILSTCRSWKPVDHRLLSYCQSLAPKSRDLHLQKHWGTWEKAETGMGEKNKWMDNFYFVYLIKHFFFCLEISVAWETFFLPLIMKTIQVQKWLHNSSLHLLIFLNSHWLCCPKGRWLFL